MRLYSVDRSPFGARVRAVIYFKSLPIEIVAPPDDGIKGPQYLSINPMGRLPTLVLDDGGALPESEIIVEYLEDAFPKPTLRPDNPVDRARSRLLARIAELYVMVPLFALFPQLAPANRDPAVVEALFRQVADGLSHIERELSDAGYAAGPGPTLADTALVPFLFWVEQIARMFAEPDPFERLPKLERYRTAMASDPLFGKIVKEMADDLAALRAKSA